MLFRDARLHIALAIALTTTAAQAERIEFRVPDGFNRFDSLTWGPIEGFAFGPSWASNLGRDTRNAPYVAGNYGAITSTFGAFTFNSIEIGGWPWDDADFGARTPMPLHFFDSSGNLIGSRSLDLTSDNSFHTFAETISGVYAVAIGSASFSSIDVRLGAITINEPPAAAVPSPSIGSLLIAGLLSTLTLARRTVPGEKRRLRAEASRPTSPR